MFQFRLGSIPVQIHYSHLLVSALLAYQGLPSADPNAASWPGRLLAERGTVGIAVYVGVWVGIVFFSVLIHELGHATVSLAFGYQPSIQLAWLGGFTRPNASGPIAWWRDVLLTLAGPLFGFLLAGACWVGSLLLNDPGGAVGFVLSRAAAVNAFWTVMNLLPVQPLDGGRISTAVLMRAFGRVGFLVSQILALVTAAGVVLLVLRFFGGGALLVVVMFGSYAMRSIQLISAYLREGPPAAVDDPFERAISEAAASFKANRLGDARDQASALLAPALPPRIRGRAHHLLGWVGLKEGKGREALDHFAQAQGQPVEPHALAAGFSLVGDDDRALALWEKAFRDHGDPTVLHEWAGTLIRLGRLDDARRLPGVDLGAASLCAERVAFLRGDFRRAAEYGMAALELRPKPEIAYDAACAFARAGDSEAALRLLERASALGFRDARFAAGDPDLASLHANPLFQAWGERVGKAVPLTTP